MRKKRIVILSQGLAPLGVLTSFANHNISWTHNSNYILLNILKLKYNKAPSFKFLWPRTTFENVIFSAEMCRFTRDCQTTQINLLITIWQFRQWPFTDSLSDLIVVWISFISSGLYQKWQLYSYESNGLIRQIHIVVFRASSNYTGRVYNMIDMIGYSGKHLHGLKLSIHLTALLVKLK